jgi:FkbM family methyltransferase
MDSDPAEELRQLRADVAKLATRVEDIARVVSASYRENLFWLKRIHNGSAIYLGDNLAVTFLANGCRAYVDTRSKDIGLHILQSGTWETHYTEAFKRLLRPGARVVDVGANLGWYSLVAGPIIGPSGRIYAVEPNPELARLIYWSLRTNGFIGFSKVFQVAVGDQPGVVDLVLRPDMPGSGFIRPTVHAVTDPPASVVRVPSVRLDDLLAEEEGPIDVVKMDIEGWEGMAIRGMDAIFARSPQLRMLIEWSTQQDYTPAPRKEVARMMEGHGYIPYRIDQEGKISRDSWEQVLTERTLTNLVLLRGEDPLAEGGG